MEFRDFLISHGNVCTLELSRLLEVTLVTFDTDLISVEEVKKISGVHLHPIKEPTEKEIYAFFCPANEFKRLYLELVAKHCALKLKEAWVNWQIWPVLGIDPVEYTSSAVKRAVDNFVPWYEKITIPPSPKRKETILKKCRQIEKTVDAFEKPPRCSSDDIEEANENYQANLEYSWEIEELSQEYVFNAKLLGYTNCRLFPNYQRIP